jgi:hypothetical protein
MSSKSAKKSLTGWDAVIRDAKQKIERLHSAIAVCEEKKAAGEPWPGDKKAGTAKAIPA